MVEKLTKERVLVCGAYTQKEKEHFQSSMEELKRLVETAQGEVIVENIQHREDINQKTMLGKGKIAEIQEQVIVENIDLVVVNTSLTPRQLANLEEILPCRVIDRTQLILDIFALRARSKEGKLQVAKAQIDYLLPRLTVMNGHLSKLGGGIGTRGPGETKLETDRRHLHRQQLRIQKELKEVKKHRELARKNRTQNSGLNIGLVGYTNAGKSTFLNVLTQAETYEKDELFATLDPLTRQYRLKEGLKMTFTDTVGFIQDLPTTLVEAFHSTLEETQNMDILFHIVDASSPERDEQEKTVLQLLDELDCQSIPVLTIYNKMDQVEGDFVPTQFPHLCLSLKEKGAKEEIETGIIKFLQEIWQPYTYSLSVSEVQKLYALQECTLVEKMEFSEEETYNITGYGNQKYAYLYEK